MTNHNLHIKPKIGSKVKVLVNLPYTIFYAEGIVKSYYNLGCSLLITKEFLRVNYSIANVGDEQKFLYDWLELAKDKKELSKLRKQFPDKNLGIQNPFIFR